MELDPIRRSLRGLGDALRSFGLWRVGAAGVLWVLIAGCGLIGGEDTDPPRAPTGLTASSGDEVVELSWEKVPATDLAGYRVYRAQDPIEGDLDQRTPVNAQPLSRTEYADESVSNGTTYHYVVTAVDEARNESPPSPNVKKTPFSEPPDRP